MAHAYTPGLRVAERAELKRERRLPLPGEVLVAEGQTVEASAVVARALLPGDVTTMHVANLLGIDAADLPEAMLVKEGQAIEQNQLLARGGGFLGLFKSEVRAPHAGTLESASKVTGQILLRGAPQPIEVDAYVRGRVAELYPREGVGVATTGIFLQGIFGIGGETRGRLMRAVASHDQTLEPGAIQASHQGAVLIGGSFASLEAIRRAIEVGAHALIVGGVRYSTLTELLGAPIGVAVTGSETIGLTLIVTEGFGTIPMAKRSFDLLVSAEGREASVNGATQIRAGVIRPEIVVPQDDPDAAGSPEPEPQGVEPGSRVRIIREPYFGALGRVAALPPEPRALETETRARIAEIELGDGRRVVVPRSNLERIEE